jgi:hypothetical protein
MAARKASSCADCLAWGVLNGCRCSSCSVWRHKRPGEAACAGCGRTLAVKGGYCRLCWQQARYRDLCRHRHRSRYAEARIMPMPGGVARPMGVPRSADVSRA